MYYRNKVVGWNHICLNNHWHAHLWRNYGFFIHYLKERRGKGKFEIVAIFHLIDHQKKKNPTKDSVVTIDDNISSNYSFFFLTDFMKTIFRKCFDRFHAKVQEKHVFIWSYISCLVLEKNTHGRKVPSLNFFFLLAISMLTIKCKQSHGLFYYIIF